MRPAAAAALALTALLACGCGDRDRGAGEIRGGERVVAPDPAAHPPGPARRILFGDLHVHTTYSIDAFVYALPLFGGEGAHPPADACDFARHCSALDFFSITDHAEGLTPERWRRLVESARQCNAVAGDPADPDLVSFVGWEWTQAGASPETHFGHKNVIFPGLRDGELPARPITSLPDGSMRRARALWLVRALQALGPLGLGDYADFLWLIERLAGVPDCPPGVHARALPPDCRENAPTPERLFEKLEQWGLPALVIPHGLAWGLHAPPGASLSLQLDRARHDPGRQRLLEIFSGHGSSEELRAWRAAASGERGEAVCPRPDAHFLPCCWRAGEIMRERCGDLPREECERRVAAARRLALEAGVAPERVFPDTRPEDWLDCDQCRDCFKPAYALRPGQSAQAALALGRFDTAAPGAPPLRFRFGFVGSSDDHKAQPGTGYKQRGRLQATDARGIASPWVDRLLRRLVRGRSDDPALPRAAPAREERGFDSLLDAERVSSFLYPGGLVAVHAEGRDRESIWRALMRREVYATSGPRILLWFELLNAPGGPLPMGGEATLAEAPRFRARALGAFVQRPGCPAAAHGGLPAQRLAKLCRGECHHPSDRRHAIRALEVVRIRPQREPGEPLRPLVEDPWRRFDCAPDPAGCSVTFSDDEYPASGRDAVYYVRALQEETPAINAANLRTRFDAEGRAASTRPCFGDARTPAGDDCLAPARERAWSSPIFVDRP